MKKILVLILTLAIVLLSGCNKSNPQNNNNDTPPNKNEQTVENDKNTTQENNKPVTSDKTENDNLNSNSKPEVIKPLKPNTSTSDKQDKNDEEKEELTTPSTPSTPTTPPVPDTTDTIVTPLGEVAPGAVCYQIKEYGTIEDWFTQDDLIFLLCQKPNSYILIDSNTGEILTQVFLPGRPIEFHLYGDEFWISFPDLKCIKIYDANTWVQKNSISFSHSIGAFDVYEDYIIYAEDNTFGKAYRYNMKTKDCVQIIAPQFRNFSLSKADVLIDHEEKSVYIGDSYGTIAYLYCFDIETLTLKTYYDGSKKGWGNLERRTFLLDGKLYWSGRVFDPYDLTDPIAEYYGYGTHHVDEYFVITTFGVFIRESGEQLLGGSINSAYSAACITESGNLMINDPYTIFIIPA